MKKIIALACALTMLLGSIVGAGATGKVGIKGDVNNNGGIDMTDYVLTKRAYFGTFLLDDGQFYRADLNGNGAIDMTDYILLKRAYFGTYTIKQPTLDSDGEATFDEVDPHVCKLMAIETIAPTCKEQGYTIYMCNCGMTEIEDVLPENGHEFGDWNVTIEPTATAEGEKKRCCINCSFTETASLEKIIDDSIYDAILTSENTELLEERIRYYLNKFRVEEGSCEMTMLSGKARLFAQGRAVQLESNFAHDTWERRELATELEFGYYVPEHPESIYDWETDEVIYTGNISPAYYEPYGGEAIGQCVTTGSTIDRIAVRLASACHNSPPHWSYVGADSNPYVAIGASIYYGNTDNTAIDRAGLVCVCVCVLNEYEYQLSDYSTK